ncbi:hypothetical protein [Polluticaenibacter yanchengensis]|uniref:Lipoprotein n=1 Tax=Polluticaenibacter yanchengensis TaxID=3014562 RepID=A0ABT4UNI3_9BACT|nr:hypothetical protein [Chitinophagaceae bacterium LY-5]
MRRIYFFLILTALFIISSCGTENTTPADENKIETFAADTTNEPLYPYAQYIDSQINYVVNAQLAVFQFKYDNGILTDSSIISKDSFRQIASQFNQPDLNLSGLRKGYTEESFQDLSTESITFMIKALNDTSVIKEVTVLLQPESKAVKNIIIKKIIEHPDYTETRNLLWVNNMNCQIVSVLNYKSGKTESKILKLEWDKPLQEI